MRSDEDYVGGGSVITRRVPVQWAVERDEFRIATVAMFTCDLYAGSPPPHDLERLRTTMQRRVVDFVRVGRTKSTTRRCIVVRSRSRSCGGGDPT